MQPLNKKKREEGGGRGEKTEKKKPKTKNKCEQIPVAIHFRGKHFAILV